MIKKARRERERKKKLTISNYSVCPHKEAEMKIMDTKQHKQTLFNSFFHPYINCVKRILDYLVLIFQNKTTLVMSIFALLLLGKT